MSTEKFVRKIRSKYIEDPFGVSGIAFWKIEAQMSNADIFQPKMPEGGACLYAVKDQKLPFYWAIDAEPFMIPLEELRDLRMLSLHHKFEGLVRELKETHNIRGYYPLKYEQDFTWCEKINDNYGIVTLDEHNTNNLLEIVDIINKNTSGDFTSKSVEEWRDNSVYAPDLWIGAINKKTNDLVGIGISTYNPPVQETDLDWFYVRKDQQGCGIGRMLVQETISRCSRKSRIIRLAGLADGFYMKCGFVQKDWWYYLTRNSAKVVGWA